MIIFYSDSVCDKNDRKWSTSPRCHSCPPKTMTTTVDMDHARLGRWKNWLWQAMVALDVMKFSNIPNTKMMGMSLCHSWSGNKWQYESKEIVTFWYEQFHCYCHLVESEKLQHAIANPWIKHSPVVCKSRWKHHASRMAWFHHPILRWWPN